MGKGQLGLQQGELLTTRAKRTHLETGLDGSTSGLLLAHLVYPQHSSLGLFLLTCPPLCLEFVCYGTVRAPDLSQPSWQSCEWAEGGALGVLPWKTPGRSQGQGQTSLYFLFSQVQRSQFIVVVGGGSAGVEMAAEIKTEYPDKEVGQSTGPSLRNSKNLHRPRRQELLSYKPGVSTSYLVPKCTRAGEGGSIAREPGFTYLSFLSCPGCVLIQAESCPLSSQPGAPSSGETTRYPA